MGQYAHEATTTFTRSKFIKVQEYESFRTLFKFAYEGKDPETKTPWLEDMIKGKHQEGSKNFESYSLILSRLYQFCTNN